jgi:putative hydrolase of the HAD superfamily
MSDQPNLSHVSQWVFDLDDTLYPAETAIMCQVEVRMTEYVARLLELTFEDAYQLQKQYLHKYGTTLNGLMANHNVDARDFLDFVHDIDTSVIEPDQRLASLISSLPGRRLVYTNGSLGHAENILHHLGLTDSFHDIFDVEASGFTPKPHREGFDRFTQHFALPISESAMFEDSLRNLKTAHGLGFTTVLVRAKGGSVHDRGEAAPDNLDHVHFDTDCLKGFLETVRTAETPGSDDD